MLTHGSTLLRTRIVERGALAPPECVCVGRPAGIPVVRKNDRSGRVFATTSPVPATCAFHLGANSTWCFVDSRVSPECIPALGGRGLPPGSIPGSDEFVSPSAIGNDETTGEEIFPAWAHEWVNCVALFDAAGRSAPSRGPFEEIVATDEPTILRQGVKKNYYKKKTTRRIPIQYRCDNSYHIIRYRVAINRPGKHIGGIYHHPLCS